MLLSEIKDPRVSGVTVTDVRVTRDLSYATVYVGVDASGGRAAALEGLERAAGFIRREMGRRLHLRKIPEFRFEADETLSHASRIEELLRQVHATDQPGDVVEGDPDAEATD